MEPLRRWTALSALWRSPWPVVSIAVAYVTLSTRDIEFGPVPGKFIVTMLALAAWLAHRRSEPPAWGGAVVAVGIAFPLFGVLVAAVRESSGDPAQQLGLRSAAEEASRFSYVLLAIPLADWARQGVSRDRYAAWLWPSVCLAALTWGLYVGHLAGIDFGASGRVGPFQGDIGVDPATGWFRAFMITNVLFIPALVLLFERLHADPRQSSNWLLLTLISGGVLLSHTRGIWVGVLVGCGVCVLLRVVIDHPPARPILPVASAVLALLLVALAAPTLARPITDAVARGATEQSSSLRYEQVSELLDGVGRHPVIGSGLGAVLPSGYRRSTETPWSFELAYLQLLFQGGIVGLALLAWLPMRVIRGTVRQLMAGRSADATVAGTAGVGAMIGLLVTYASNPYLVTSAGTLALAISVALCDAARPSVGEVPRFRIEDRQVSTSAGHPGGG